jgi:hypothetical protein
MLLAIRLQDFGLGNEILAEFVKSDWLQALFKPQPFIGVRHLLMRAATRFRELGFAQTSPKPPSMEEAFAAEVNKVRSKPALHQYNQDCLMWFTQVLIEGFDGVKVKRPRNRYFSTQWEWKHRSVYFAFEGGDNNGRWRAMAKEAAALAGKGSCAVVFRTPDLKPVPGPRWAAARQVIDEACRKGLRIERLNLDQVCELHAAREFHSNALQGNVEFTPADVLAWLKRRFRPWCEKYSSVGTHNHEPPPISPSKQLPADNAPTLDGSAPLPARLSQGQLRRVLDHMRRRLLVDINEVLEVLGSASLREALLLEVERHPNLKAHPGPQTIYLQWRIA